MLVVCPEDIVNLHVKSIAAGIEASIKAYVDEETSVESGPIAKAKEMGGRDVLSLVRFLRALRQRVQAATSMDVWHSESTDQGLTLDISQLYFCIVVHTLFTC